MTSPVDSGKKKNPKHFSVDETKVKQQLFLKNVKICEEEE